MCYLLLHSAMTLALIYHEMLRDGARLGAARERLHGNTKSLMADKGHMVSNFGDKK